MQSPIEIGKQIAALGRLKLLYEVVLATPIIPYAPDGNGVFTLLEGRGPEMLGSKPGEIVGRSVFELYEYQPKVWKEFVACWQVQKRPRM